MCDLVLSNYHFSDSHTPNRPAIKNLMFNYCTPKLNMASVGQHILFLVGPG